MLVHVSRRIGIVVIAAGLGMACGATEEATDVVRRNQAVSETTARSDLPVEGGQHLTFDPGALPGIVVGDWHERDASLRTKEVRDDSLATYELRHRIETSEDVIAHANAHPDEYMAVIGAYGDESHEGIVNYLVRIDKRIEQPEPKPDDDAVPVSNLVVEKLSPPLKTVLETADSTELIPILVSLSERLQTDLEPPPFSILDFSGDQKAAVGARKAEVARRVLLREEEARASQAPFVAKLKKAGAEVEPEGSIWLANAIVAKAPPTLISQLEKDEGVASIRLNPQTMDLIRKTGHHSKGEKDGYPDGQEAEVQR